MAIQLLKENDKFNTYHQHFLIDGSDDLTSLEANYKCQMGDCAELLDGTVYVRHSDGYSGDLWEIRSSSSGSSDGGGGGGGSYAAEWTRQNENICFASLEAVSDSTWDVFVQCSDGAMAASFTASYDSNIGDWWFEWGDWTNSEVTPIPNIENYTNVIQNNIAAAIAPLIMHYPQGKTLTWSPLPTIVIVSRLPYVDVQILA